MSQEIMRIAKILLVFFLFVSTAEAIEIGVVDVHVEIFSKHPFLVDHQRTLVIMKNGKELSEIKLYDDPGSRVPLHVFENEEELIFIDCNGVWFVLNEQNGQLTKLKWVWKRDLPKQYIGTFRLRVRDKTPSFVKEPNITKDDVYLFKDPS